MSELDKILSLAQRQGEFGARRTFSLESSRALEKLRRFALPNPHQYILELVQGLVANEANILSFSLGAYEFTLSTCQSGRGFPASRLQRLFEAIFATNSEGKDADLRGLAMAFNTLNKLRVQKIRVETGDGTLQGSSFWEIENGKTELGALPSAVKGTEIVIGGGQRDPKLEEGLLRDHCMSSHVPIMVNGQNVSSNRLEKYPLPFGYRNCLRFDEGDLYGTIGQNSLERAANFKLMVHGVHLWTFEIPDYPDAAQLGGIICFNRLQKTADSADAVRDEVWAELWGRLRPYADFVLGKSAAVVPAQVHVVGDLEPVLLRHLRKRLEGVFALVLVDAVSTDIEKARANIIAELLDGLALVVSDSLRGVVKSLVGPHVNLVAPCLRDSSVIAFFNQERAVVPSHFAGKKPLSNLELGEFEQGGESVHQGKVFASAYYSRNSRSSLNGTVVRFVSFGRKLWEGVVLGAHRGVFVEAEFASMTPEQLTSRFAAEELAEWLLHSWEKELDIYVENEVKVMLAAGVKPFSAPAHEVMAQLEAGFSLGYRKRGTRLYPHFTNWSNRGLGPARFKVFQTVAGGTLSLHDLPRLIDRNLGLIYLVRAKEDALEPTFGVDLRGLKLDQILLVDTITENCLSTIAGEASIVQVDARDVLAEVDGLVLRDVAFGMRSYAKRTLPAERMDGRVLIAEEVRPHIEDLLSPLFGAVAEFRQTFSGENAARALELEGKGAPPADLVEWLRHAVRHLQWAAVHVASFSVSLELQEKLRSFPLFATTEGTLVSFDQLTRRERVHGFVPVMEGVAEDLLSVVLKSPRASAQLPDEERFVLAMSSFVVHILSPHIKLGTAVIEERFRPTTSVDEGGLLVVEHLKGEVQGTVGVVDQKGEAIVAISRPGVPAEWVSGQIGGLSLFGRLFLPENVSFDAALLDVRQRLFQKMERLAGSYPDVSAEAKKKDRAIAALLKYIASHLRLTAHKGQARFQIHDADAKRVAEQLMLSRSGMNSRNVMGFLRVLESFPGKPMEFDHSDDVNMILRSFGEKLWDFVIENKIRPAGERRFLVESPVDYAEQVRDALLSRIDSQPPVKPEPVLDSKPAFATESLPQTSPVLSREALVSRPTRTPEAVVAKEAAPKAFPPVPAPIGGMDSLAEIEARTRLRTELDRRWALLRTHRGEEHASVSKPEPVKDSLTLRSESEPELPWLCDNPVVGIEPNGAVCPRTLARVIAYWIFTLSGTTRRVEWTTVHFRAVTRNRRGVAIEQMIPSFPNAVRGYEVPMDETLRLGGQKYSSSSEKWVARAYAQAGDERTARLAVVFNAHADLVKQALANQAALTRFFPTLLLAAFSAANYRYTSILAEHEEAFQEAVLQRLIASEPYFSVKELEGTAPLYLGVV